jgi:hypothetical protein
MMETRKMTAASNGNSKGIHRLSCGVLCGLAVILGLLSVTVANPTSSATHKVHDVTGTVGKSITISCYQGTPQSPPHSVEWSDRVYATDLNPQPIFRSDTNPGRVIDQSHPNRVNYAVDAEYRLTISNLNLNADAGEYICRSVNQVGTVHERRYYLSIAGKSTCTGPQQVQPGHRATLQCEMPFSSASSPTVHWFADKEPLESQDLFEPGQARREVTITAEPDDDKRPYRCTITLGDVVEECSVVMNVPHSVRAVQFVSTKKIYQVGEELRCSARGNPTPQIVLNPTVAEAETSGEGWKSIRIPAEWENEQKTINCEAANDVDGKTSTVSASIAFNVTAAPKSTAGQSTGMSRGTQKEFYGATLVMMSVASLLTVTALFH